MVTINRDVYLRDAYNQRKTLKHGGKEVTEGLRD
jgi:hypothetical protein